MIVDSGDFKPTDQSYAVFKDLSAQLDQQLQRLESLMKTELPAFNKELAKKETAAGHAGERSTVTSTIPTGSSRATNRSLCSISSRSTGR